jgi:hypothetical protein
MRIFTFLFAGILFFHVASLEAQQDYALVFPKNADGFTASILRIDRDSIIYFKEGIHSIGKTAVAKIILHKKKEPGKNFAICTIAGFYGMNYLLGTASGQPSPFLSENTFGGRNGATLSVIGIGMLSVIAGGGIGYLTDLNREANSTLTIEFTGNPEWDTEKWEHVSAFQSRNSEHSRIHLSFSGGSVLHNISSTYFDDLAAAGFNNSYSYYSNYSGNSNLMSYNDLQAATNFNWFRKVFLSYSLTDDIQAGITYASIGEPSFLYYKSSYDEHHSIYAGQRFAQTGYYINGGYSIFFGEKKDFEALLSGGLGIAKINFKLNANLDSTSSERVLQQVDFTYDKTVLSGFISASVSYYLYDSFSLGLSGNYFFSGKAVAPAIPFAGIKEHELHFSNGDIGFTMGLHF